MSTDFLGNTEHMDEFTEHYLRCMNSRNARFIGKRVACVDRRGLFHDEKHVEIFVTLAGTHVAYFRLIRADKSEFSKHAACNGVGELAHFFSNEVADTELGKLAMIEAGIDDAVDIP